MSLEVIIGAVVLWIVIVGVVLAACVVAGRADEANGAK